MITIVAKDGVTYLDASNVFALKTWGEEDCEMTEMVIFTHGSIERIYLSFANEDSLNRARADILRARELSA